MTLIFDILDTYHHLKAQEAQLHYQGASLTNPVAWHQSLTRNWYLKKQKRDQELALLETVQAAACWPIDRVHEIHPEVPNQCPLCQQEVDKWHTCWTCPNLLQIDDADIKDNNYLITQIQEALSNDQHLHESLWLRGLLTTEQITPSQNHNPLEEYSITVRHIEYIPSEASPTEVKPQPSLNRFLKQHLPKPAPLEPLDTPPAYNPPVT